MRSVRDDHFDVIVAGGGAGGISAAVAAARMGARVLLIERYGFLGGAAANSLVLAYCGFFLKGRLPVPAVGGIGTDLLSQLEAIGQDVAPVMSRSGNWIVMLDPEAVKYAFDRLACQAGITVLLHSRVTGVSMKDGNLCGVVVTNHAGQREVGADAYVDASGEATLVFLAGTPMSIDSRNGDHVQPASLPVRIGGVAADVSLDRRRLEDLIAAHNLNSDTPIHRADGGVMSRLPLSGDYWWMAIDLGTDGLSGASLTAAEQQARREAWRNLDLLRKLPGFEKAYIVSTGPQIGIRETRRPRSREDVTGEALSVGHRRADGIGRAAWPMEVHEAPGRMRFVDLGGKGFADIPLAALRATGPDNLFLAGRTIGADEKAYGSVRVMGTAFASGHAAGVAAAQWSQDGSVSADTVRRVLASQDALI